MSKLQQHKKTNTDQQTSTQSKKDELKKISDNIVIMKNRVMLLKQQLQKQKDHIRKNKQLTKQTLQKKIQVNKINRYKQKDNTKELKKLERQKQKNTLFRLSHQKQLLTIQKAIFLVKLDDARQSKTLSSQNHKKINQMQKQFLEEHKQKKQKIYYEEIEGKKKYQLYWKDKANAVYNDQVQTVAQIQEKTEKKKQQLEQLQIQQSKLMEQISKYHTQNIQSKNQYQHILKLPAKDIQQESSNTKPTPKPKKNQRFHHSNKSQHTSPRTSIDHLPLKLPNVFINQTKLKIVLKQLKQTDDDKQIPFLSHRQKQ